MFPNGLCNLGLDPRRRHYDNATDPTAKPPENHLSASSTRSWSPTTVVQDVYQAAEMDSGRKIDSGVEFLVCQLSRTIYAIVVLSTPPTHCQEGNARRMQNVEANNQNSKPLQPHHTKFLACITPSAPLQSGDSHCGLWAAFGWSELERSRSISDR